MVLTKSKLIAALKDEIRILVHLAGKIQPSMLDYRPTPKQRSTLDLLRYMAIMGPTQLAVIEKGYARILGGWSDEESRTFCAARGWTRKGSPEVLRYEYRALQALRPLRSYWDRNAVTGFTSVARSAGR